MHVHRTSRAMIGLLVATQLGGPALLWAADQRGVRIEATRRVVVSALSGDQLTLQNGVGTKTLQFREGVAAGDRLTTGDRTMAEVLIGNRAVVTVGQGASVQFTSVTPEQTTIQVSKGTVRVAAAASALGEQGLVTVQIPTGQVQTRGGIVRVLVDTPVRVAEQGPMGEARPYLASYSPTIVAGVVLNRGEIIQVEEGLAEIVGTGPGAKGVTLQGGQAITLQGGQAGPIAGITTQDTLRPGVVATAGHRSTPKEGMDNLVALQVDQATQLGKALTGAAETGEGESGKKDESGKALNGATGGVSLANTVSAALFGTNNPLLAGTGGINVSQSGSGAVDDSSDADDMLRVTSLTASAKGGIGQLLFTNDGARLSKIAPTKELLLVDGGVLNNAAHQGRTPQGTLVVLGYNGNHPREGTGGFVDPKTLPIQWSMVNSVSRVPLAGIRQTAVVGLVKAPGDIRAVLETVDSNGIRFGTGALSDFSSREDGIVYTDLDRQSSGNLVGYLNGAITARSAASGNQIITLAGGVVLDKGTNVSLGATDATDIYFNGKNGAPSKPGLSIEDAKFRGSLLSVLASQDGGYNNPAFVKIQDRALGVLDGSAISETAGNKVALLSVLDSRLTGPSGSDPSTGANGRNSGEIAPLIEVDGVLADRSLGTRPSVNVTSAVVVRSTNVTLDGALLSASSPLLAMMNADMTTTSHFADLAGNNGRPALLASLVPGDALVRLNNNSVLTIQGNLLNLNNATASVTGYLFSLNGGSTLNLNGGGLFSLTGGSALTLNGSAFGVFGSGTNTLSINNNFCGGGAACGFLVNASNTPITLPNGTQLRVAGVNQNLVLPNSFNVFAVTQNAPTPTVTLSANAALFKVEGTSALTINGTKVR